MNQTAFTLTNPQTKALAFKIFMFEDGSYSQQLSNYNYYLKIFLINASRIKLNQSPDKIMGEKEPFVLQTLKDAIEVHYKTKHSAGEYADLLNISVRALSRIGKTQFNKTLTSLIAERIIIEAKRELYLTAKPVKTIAFELGFSDEFYFSRFFKRNAVVSPQTYRETVGFSRGEV